MATVLQKWPFRTQCLSTVSPSCGKSLPSFRGPTPLFASLLEPPLSSFTLSLDNVALGCWMGRRLAPRLFRLVALRFGEEILHKRPCMRAPGQCNVHWFAYYISYYAQGTDT